MIDFFHVEIKNPEVATSGFSYAFLRGLNSIDFLFYPNVRITLSNS